MDMKLFDKAENIAHSYFWLSDDCAVRREAIKVIKKSPWYDKCNAAEKLAHYVTVICHCASCEGIRQIESL